MHASEVLFVFTKIAFAVVWRMDLRGASLGAGAPQEPFS